nr:MAG TPA: hypothetical protein [Crassvirales sp.]
MEQVERNLYLLFSFHQKQNLFQQQVRSSFSHLTKNILLILNKTNFGLTSYIELQLSVRHIVHFKFQQ